MSQNPYAQPYPQQYQQGYQQPPGYGMQAPPRTSALAILSLVCSLLCCTAPLGVVFGGLAMIGIGMSGGRVKGVGLALAGLVIGIIATVVLYGGMFVAVMGLNVFAQPVGSTLAAIEQRDADTVKSAFAQSVAGAIDRDRVNDFARAMESDLGPFDAAPDGFGDWWSGYGAVFSATGQQAMEDAQDRSSDAVPLPMRFDGKWVMVFVVPDETEQASNGLPRFRDIGYVRPDGSINWFMDEQGGGFQLPDLNNLRNLPGGGAEGENGGGGDPLEEPAPRRSRSRP